MRERVFPAIPARRKNQFIDIDPGVRQHGLPLARVLGAAGDCSVCGNFARQANQVLPCRRSITSGWDVKGWLGDMRKLTISHQITEIGDD